MSEKNIKDYNLLPANLRVAWGEVTPTDFNGVYTDATMLVFKRFLSDRINLALEKRINPNLPLISSMRVRDLLTSRVNCCAKIEPVALEEYPRDDHYLPVITVVCEECDNGHIVKFNAYRWSWMVRTLKPAKITVDPLYVYSEAFFLNQNNEVLGILMPVRR
jgi:hypothetical protein